MSGFWSQRKAAVAAEVEAEERLSKEQDQAAREAALEEKTDEEILAQFDLPDPDTLNEGDDFTRFLKEAVPNRIKTRALRRLWLTNPVLANVDGLVDYGEDFTDANLVVENLQSAYQVGKGMLKHVEEMARQAAAEEDAAEEPTELPDDEVFEVAAPEVEEVAAFAEPEHATDASEVSEPPLIEDTSLTPMPRRMRFSFASEEGVAT